MSWQSKKVLVTGAGGFIPSHLAERLVQEGAEVRALVHYNALGSRGWLDHSAHAGEMEILAGDLCDRDSVRAAVDGADVVFHLGALIAIPYSYQAPFAYLRTNAEGTMNVLQAARESGCSRVVHTSTSEVYGSAQQVPIPETHPLQGQSPYSASKIAADKMAEAFAASFEVPVVTVRPFNTYGPRQSARAVIPTIISQCLAGKSHIQLGTLTPTRDMNYVSNTVEGFLAAASTEQAIGDVFNLGSGREISIGDLAHLIAERCGVTVEISSDDQRVRPDKSEVNRLLADASKAKAVLGWEARVSLEEGLQLTIDWIRAHPQFFRPDEYTV